MRVHIRRPSTNRSFCDKVEAPELSASESIVNIENREESNCFGCRRIFTRVMYAGKSSNLEGMIVK